MRLWGEIADFLRRDGRAALVTLTGVRGSSPREAGARMAVRADGAFRGTIGGGALEWWALAEARRLMAGTSAAGETLRQSLGPDLGQCCGGSVELRIEAFDAGDLDWIVPLAATQTTGALVTRGTPDGRGRIIRRAVSTPGAPPGEIIETFGEALTPVYLFGAGHVGRALVMALAPLPFFTIWSDSRADAFPEAVPANVRLDAGTDAEALLAGAPPGSAALVMTHSHALDLALVAKLLPDLRFQHVGLIGSATKKARFAGQLRAAGLAAADIARLVCPIGGGFARDKSPAAIAACVAVELLGYRERAAALTPARGAIE